MSSSSTTTALMADNYTVDKGSGADDDAKLIMLPVAWWSEMRMPTMDNGNSRIGVVEERKTVCGPASFASSEHVERRFFPLLKRPVVFVGARRTTSTGLRPSAARLAAILFPIPRGLGGASASSSSSAEEEEQETTTSRRVFLHRRNTGPPQSRRLNLSNGQRRWAVLVMPIGHRRCRTIWSTLTTPCWRRCNCCDRSDRVQSVWYSVHHWRSVRVEPLTSLDEHHVVDPIGAPSCSRLAQSSTR
jgi:hypothetical protein